MRLFGIVICGEMIYNRVGKQVNVMDALRKEEVYTIKDIYALPDGERLRRRS